MAPAKIEPMWMIPKVITKVNVSHAEFLEIPDKGSQFFSMNERWVLEEVGISKGHPCICILQ